MQSTVTGPTLMPSVTDVAIRVHEGQSLRSELPRLSTYVTGNGPYALSRHPGWLNVLERGLKHRSFCLEAVANGQTRGLLPLAYVRSLLFGRFLVSLPYVNYGGVVADDDRIAGLLIDHAIRLGADLNVRYLELRHEHAIENAQLPDRLTTKVHSRLALPATAGALWDDLDPKVRNQVRKGQKSGLTVGWGGLELMPDFYGVFSQNMRDLGTPVFGRGLFRAILEEFPDRAEFCVTRLGEQPVAAALLLHGDGMTEVPSASSLREFNATCANMLTYWHLLERAIQRQQTTFDFGRSTQDGPTFRFKKQWGAQPFPATWQYHVWHGNVGAMRPDNPRYNRAIRIWQKLPVAVTRLIGPAIVRGIP